MDTPAKIGRYEILEELGRGAMGVVYRAKDPSMGRIVAVKTIISVALAGPQGQEFRERFFREARTAGGLAHPGIVAMFDVGEHEGMPFLVMEYITGSSLADFARSRDRLLPERICELGAQIAEALSFAHQRGIVHRDIKPANIMMTSPQAHGIERPKITDFGVAKLAEGHTTMTGQMVGTPAYMPPEQFTGATIDARSDIFSLGVLLYWLATGEQPFPGESITAVSYKIVQTDPIPPRRLNPAIPQRLESIILKCMSKSPDERYQSGDELARDLNNTRKPATGELLFRKQAAKFDPDATVVDMPAASVAANVEATTPQASPGKVGGDEKKQPSWALVAGLCVIAVGTAAWFVLRPGPPAEPSTSPGSTGALTNPPIATVSPESPPPTVAPLTQKATPAVQAQSAPTTPGASPAKENPVSTSATGSPTEKNASEPLTSASLPVDFDPRQLDRKTNARIEFDVSQMPAKLEFTVEMNGRIYYQKTGESAYKKVSDLYVPTGVHEFQVKARSSAGEKVSNTVSTDFKPNKRLTLKLELRLQDKPAEVGMPADLYPNSQLVLTLKQ